MTAPGWRGLTATLVSGVLALGLCACQATAVRAKSAPTASASGPTSSAGSRGIPQAAFANHKPFTGPAVAQYGQAGLLAAYQEVVNFAFQTGWNPTLIRKDYSHLALADLGGARVYMTPSCRKAFDATLGKVVQADKAATQKLEEAMFFGVTGPNGMMPVPLGHVVTDRRFSEASAGLEGAKGAGRLSISFAAQANIQMQDSVGRHFTMATSRVMRYLLVRNTGSDRARRPFLIDAWAIRMRASRPQAAA